MAWQDVSVIQLRHTINDVDDPQRYEDIRLQLAWLAGASFVINEFTLSNTYTVDLTSMDITPDPTVAGSQPGQVADPWAVNLITLRASIFMIQNDLKLAANSAFSVRDVHMSVDTREIYKANQLLLKEVKEQYDQLRMQYNMGVKPAVAAIVSPLNIISAGYRRPIGFYNDRSAVVF